ncbi:hypothetical protein TcYC6_0081890 [Trypanosoma cruzi]|nr:hypothetical protein TcYC6_0081890 [Trypanosoma cruzi]
MQRVRGIPSPANPTRRNEEEEDEELVRQLVEAADVDEVIERMEMKHYRHISPILQGLRPFRRASANSLKRRPLSCEPRLGAPLRSPAEDAAGPQGSHEEPMKNMSSLPHPVASTSPTPSDQSTREQRRQSLALGIKAPARSPHASDGDASSAPHENEHTEKPSVNRRHRARSHRKKILRPPIESPSVVDSPLTPLSPLSPSQSRRLSNASQRRRRHTDIHQASSFGGLPRHFGDRQWDLQRSYRELSGLRPPSVDKPSRRSQLAWHEYYDPSHDPSFGVNAYRGPPTQPNTDTSFIWRRSSSPPVILPPFASPVEDDAETQYTGRASHYSRGDYWGHMRNGFEGTPTATTEEAHTPDDVEYDEEEDVEFVSGPPRIIEREQHLRSRVTEPPLNKFDARVAPKGNRRKSVGKVSPARENNNNINNNRNVDYDHGNDGFRDPSHNTHTVEPRLPHYVNAKGAGSSNKFISPSDREVTQEGHSLSSLAAPSRDYAMMDLKEEGDFSHSRRQSWSHSTGMVERRRSTQLLGTSENTSRPDHKLVRQNGQRMSPALSPTRQDTPPPVSQNPHDEKTRSERNVGSNRKVDEGAQKHRRGQKHAVEDHSPHSVDRTERKEKNMVSPFLSSGSGSSYSYTYSSQSSSSSAASVVKSTPGPPVEATSKNMPKSSTVAVKPRLEAKVFPPHNPRVHPRPKSLGWKKRNPPLLLPHSVLQRQPAMAPPPPCGMTMASAATVRPLLRNSFVEMRSDGTMDRGFISSTRTSNARFPSKQQRPQTTYSTSIPRFDRSAQSVPGSTTPRASCVSSPSYPQQGSTGASVPMPKPLPTQMIPRGSCRSASEPAATARFPVGAQPIVWRTSDGDSVAGKNRRVPPAAKTGLTLYGVLPQQRSMSVGDNPPPPSKIPLRARNSIGERRSLSANRVVDVPQRRPSQNDLLAANRKRRSSVAISFISPSDGEVCPAQTVFIQLPYKAK